MDPQELLLRIERAFDYRGHVSVDLVDGGTEYGFLFNRDLSPGPLYPRGKVELFRASDDSRVTIGVDRIADIRFTGRDHFKPFQPQDPA